jgi:CheY-like chemotaxis protein
LLLSRRPQWPQVEHDQIVKRAKLLVIDDGEFPYLKLFRKDGYNFDKWNKIKDLPALESGKYDVILLDLHGVGEIESSEQGLGVLGHLRKRSPAQIVVAYSNAEWSVEYQEFFRSADAVLHKSKADYVTFKRTVDDLLDQRFSLGFYMSRISQALQGTGIPDGATRKAEKAILTGRLRPFEKYLAKQVTDPVTVERVLGIAQVAVGVLQLWSN